MRITEQELAMLPKAFLPCEAIAVCAASSTHFLSIQRPDGTWRRNADDERVTLADGEDAYLTPACDAGGPSGLYPALADALSG